MSYYLSPLQLAAGDKFDLFLLIPKLNYFKMILSKSNYSLEDRRDLTSHLQRPHLEKGIHLINLTQMGLLIYSLYSMRYLKNITKSDF